MPSERPVIVMRPHHWYTTLLKVFKEHLDVDVIPMYVVKMNDVRLYLLHFLHQFLSGEIRAIAVHIEQAGQ